MGEYRNTLSKESGQTVSDDRRCGYRDHQFRHRDGARTGTDHRALQSDPASGCGSSACGGRYLRQRALSAYDYGFFNGTSLRRHSVGKSRCTLDGSGSRKYFLYCKCTAYFRKIRKSEYLRRRIWNQPRSVGTFCHDTVCG